MAPETVIQINQLNIAFDKVEVIKNVSLQINQGEILGIVGESGSGKSLTSLAIMGLLPENAQVSGSILFNNGAENIEILHTRNSAKLRGNQISMIFQEPMTSLNPSMRCGQQVMESILLHQKTTKQSARQKVLELFEQVKLPNPERIFSAYPHELSGGQKQRVMISMAIASRPKLLIADEPTTALDVTVQKSILELLKELKNSLGMSIIFISHDLGVIAELCDRVAVMYRGEIVEHGDIQHIFYSAQEAYTKGLIACRPEIEGRLKKLPVVSDFTENKEISYEKETEIERQARFDKIYSQKPILEIKNLNKYFTIHSGYFKSKNEIKAVQDVSFELYKGETLGLVGESGSGKTTLSRTLLLLEKPTQGEIIYEGKDLVMANKKEIRQIRKDIQIIFQDPYSSLNPRQNIQQIITEPLMIHGIGAGKKDRLDIAANLLEKVNMSSDALNKYPHEFSGGQRQRIGIARALALRPKIIICDESVSALDVSVQAQVLNLLNDLKEEFGLTYLFISHDLSVVKYMSDRLIVLRHGEVQEYGNADEIYANPSTNYTRELIAAIPKL
ncbi:MAG: ABC transporter ATP-binding protein [Flavobacteriaceae bacterium]|nr:ABC transporter ATP-binding protein [Flavobacteriaceae bacterium]